MMTTGGAGYHHHPMTLEEVRTLWIGDLQYWVDENYLNSCFAHTGEVVITLRCCSKLSLALKIVWNSVGDSLYFY